MRKKIFGFIFILSSITGFGQYSKGLDYFTEPIMIDSLSTVVVPVKIDGALMSSNKLGYGEYYSNIIFYDFKNDVVKQLFNDETIIRGFDKEYNYYNYEKKYKLDNVCSKWMFYFVKSHDYSEDGKIDKDDPFILYVSDKSGNGLKPISPLAENAVSIDIYEKQGFALIKMQIDLDKNKRFGSGDKKFYYIRLDLNTLMLGSKIET